MNDLNCFKQMQFERKTLSEEKIDSMELALKRATEYSFAVIYSADGVYPAKVENGKIITHIGTLPENITEFRAFDKDGELHVVKCGNGLKGRIITDGKGNAVEAFDERHILFGEHCKPAENGFYRYEEDRGTVLYLPFAITGRQRAYIEIRNYAVTLDGDISFVDWRMVSFGKEEVKE